MIDIRIQEEDFSISEEWERCRERIQGRAGAIVAFGGIVRDKVDDESVLGLYLEHYPGMTEKSIEKIVAEALQKWSLLDIIVVHRIGTLQAQDQIVLVLVGASHRPDAFSACEFIMDFLKTEAVFWKKEIRQDGETWVKSTNDDFLRNRRWTNT